MPNKESKTPEVFVVGGGWAGLSCTVNLRQQGFSPQIFEASRQLGGRARCTKYKELILDNGQHILSGACKETLKLFQLLGMQEADYIYRQPLKLDLLTTNKLTADTQNLHIHPANLPAPLHLFFAFLNAKNIKFKDKYHLIKFFVFLMKRIKNYLSQKYYKNITNLY